MSPKYTQVQFNDELANMLREAKEQRKLRRRIVESSELHDRVVNHAPVIPPNEKRMPSACFAMFRLALHQRGKAKLVSELPNGPTSTIKIEFDTADLPG
ncbi:MAG: hypothetical protein OXU31_00345 [Gammaproteobacteria bacterium]|nr:hypothetical protein [Gammaproteobacteria bacterium]